MPISRKLTFTPPTPTTVKGQVFSLLLVILKGRDSLELKNTRSPHAWARPGLTSRKENHEGGMGRNAGSPGHRLPPARERERALPAAVGPPGIGPEPGEGGGTGRDGQ